MKVTQVLASGTIVRQDFRDSVRFVMFATGVEEWEYATHGGTAFVVNLGGKLYGLTCRHVFRDFNWQDLRLTERKFGSKFPGLKSMFSPSSPREGAVNSDILDVAVIEFADDVGAGFFTDPPYIIDASSVGTSREGDSLLVNGALKEKCEIASADSITPTFALLELQDRGANSSDATLREAYAEFDRPDFGSVTGISGSPVFNATTKRLCGMVVRGNLLDRRACTLWYVDIADILQVLNAVAHRRTETYYRKTLRRLRSPAVA